MVLYKYDSNAILTEPLKNHTTQELVRSQIWLIQYLIDQGLKPSARRIENECPEAIQNFFRANSVDFHLCPPNNHHSNQSEKAIDIWKCHLLAGISGVNPNFPMHLWCRLLRQSTLT